MPSNKKVGNDFEANLCEILFGNGFWAHNMAQKAAGQPADVIAVRNRVAYLIDCKVCSTRKGFSLARMEENQNSAMELWKECGNGEGWFAVRLPDGNIYMLPHFVVRATRSQKTAMTPSEVFEIGKPLEEWMKQCK